MNGRRQILNSIRRALGPHRDPPAPPRHGETETGGERAVLVERFVVEAVAVDAEVLRGPSEEILEKRFGAEGVAGALLPSHPIPRDGREVPLAITRAEWGIADTGTVVEFHPAGSQSAASSIAATHAVILSEDRILPDLATFYHRFGEALEQPDDPRYAVLITGPSRTADIEQTLVLGAHGPRELLIVVEPADGEDSCC